MEYEVFDQKLTLVIQTIGKYYKESEHPFDTFVKIICHQQAYDNSGLVIYNTIRNICGSNCDFITALNFLNNYTYMVPFTTGLDTKRINTIYEVARLGKIHTARNICNIISNLSPIGNQALTNFMIDTGIATDCFPTDDKAVNRVIKQKLNMNITEFVKTLNFYVKTDQFEIYHSGELFWYLQEYATNNSYL